MQIVIIADEFQAGLSQAEVSSIISTAISDTNENWTILEFRFPNAHAVNAQDPGTVSLHSVDSSQLHTRSHWVIELERSDLQSDPLQIAEIIRGSDLILTAQAEIHHQTLAASVVDKASQIARHLGIPAAAFAESVHTHVAGINSVLSVVNGPLSPEELREDIRDLLYDVVSQQIRLIHGCLLIPGTAHHTEIYVSDFERSRAFYLKLLGHLGYRTLEAFQGGISLIRMNHYLVFVQTEEKHQNQVYHRCKTGLNHLAFRVASESQMEEIREILVELEAPLLYMDRYPNAGGHAKALYAEDPDRIKLEFVVQSLSD